MRHAQINVLFSIHQLTEGVARSREGVSCDRDLEGVPWNNPEPVMDRRGVAFS